MDTRLRPIIQADIGDNSAINRNRRNGVLRNSTGPPPERRSTISGMMPAIYENTTRMRNLSGGSSGSAASGSSIGSSINLDNHLSDTQVFLPDMLPFANSTFNSSSTISQNRGGSSMSQRKFDRSFSDSDNDRLGNGSQRSVNSSRYKTELCRPFEESGSCKYGDKCQFAHGMHELRNLARHPKYKTELCRTFHSSGFCPYGPRCHFIHADDGKVESSPKVSRQTRSSSYSGNSTSYPQSSNSGSSSPSLSPIGSDNDYNIFNYLDSSNTRMLGSVENHQFNSLTVNINNFCSNNNDIQALESQFNSALNLNRNNMNDNVFGGTFSCSSDPAEEEDIFSKVTMFKTEEVDNVPNKAPGFNSASVKLDNFPSTVGSSALWPTSCFWGQQPRRPMDQGPFHHSPTGSFGSDGSDSDCSGSTESLDSSGCREISGYLLQHH